MNDMTPPQPSRRALLNQLACGFGSLALTGMGAEQALAGNPLAPQKPLLIPRAKRVIFIFMQGGPSQVDTFDPKPHLTKYDGQKVDFYNSRSMKVSPEPVMKEMWKFKKHGQCGQPVSELFPHIARHVDDLCFIHSMHTEGVAHGPATLFLHSGATNLIRPSMGAWISYGLGTVNQNLPAFVSINPPMTKGGPRNYASAFLPPVHQGTALGRAGVPSKDTRFRHVTNQSLTTKQQKQQFEYLRQLNAAQIAAAEGRDAEVEAMIDSFELAFRLQNHAPDIMDISNESAATRAMYGIDEDRTDDFGRQCLLARRLAEADVRYIQVNYSDHKATPRWDQHNNMPEHATHAAATDKPVAGLLADLKQRGLLEDTLVWWGGEFGRTPYTQNNNGRDHNPAGFTVFLAGGGVKAGYAHGQTDEWGHHAVQDKVHMHDLHATILYALGLDHEKLTYAYAGRDFRLTDVAGNIVHELFA